LPKLTKMLLKELELVPEGISSEKRGANTITLILRNLSALTGYLAELRGMYGSGHGRDGKHRGLQPRHRDSQLPLLLHSSILLPKPREKKADDVSGRPASVDDCRFLIRPTGTLAPDRATPFPKLGAKLLDQAVEAYRVVLGVYARAASDGQAFGIGLIYVRANALAFTRS
jgi:hypothetical protein